MNSIRLTLSKPTEKLPAGSSKFFGNPDVWEDFEWPCAEDDGELYDLSFICQINCAEASKHDTEGLLPKTGMLYFFYDLDEMPWEPYEADAARVVYYNGDLSMLHEMVVVDEDGNEDSYGEMSIGFSSVDEGFLSEDSQTHLMLGIPSLDAVNIPELINDWQMLLQIDSLETDDICLNFTDEGVLCFYIEPEKLSQKDFSDVRIWQIYS